MQTSTYAVMFTDIEGFTARTSQQTRAENERMLQLHDALLLPVVHGYRGRRVKTIGDAYLVVFDSATRAIACGAAVLDRLALYNDGVAEAERIELRVALATGEIRLTRGDVFGEAVNVASRVEGVVDAGDVCFTEATYLLADRSAFETEELGPVALRGLPEPVRLYRLRRNSDPTQPFGGAALEALRLPPPTVKKLSRYRAPWPRPLRHALLFLALLGSLAALYVNTAHRREGPIERIEQLTSEGRLEEARTQLRQLGASGGRPAEIAYLEGVIAHAAGKKPRAIQRYRAAAEIEAAFLEERVGPRLQGFLTDPSCGVRTAAAQALGALRHVPARRALEQLAAREPKRGGGFLAQLGLDVGCESGDAARAALERLTDR